MTQHNCKIKLRPLFAGFLLTAVSFGSVYAGNQFTDKEFIPTGMSITPTAAFGSDYQPLNPDLPGRPDWLVDHAVDMVASPDGNTLLILTSGYNRVTGDDGSGVAEESNEYVFIYDITGNKAVKKQVLQIPNTFNGIVWNPNGEEFYVSGGVDDNVHVFSRAGSGWAESGDPIALGHDNEGEGIGVRPMAAGLSVNMKGNRLLVANFENDSVSLINLVNRTVVNELDLRPGKIDPSETGTPGGTFPFAVQFKGDDFAYVSVQRDREIVKLAASDDQLTVARRIEIDGQPNKMTLNKAQSKLFVASDNDDSVLVIDTGTDAVVEKVVTVAPERLFKNKKALKGANPNNVALSPDEQFLFVTNGGTNAVAVIELGAGAYDVPEANGEAAAGSHRWQDHIHRKDGSAVIGLIPTGWYPSAVATSGDGSMLYVINSKDVAGPNPEGCRDTLSIASGSLNTCRAANQYVWQLHKAGFLTMPMPKLSALVRLTRLAADNSHLSDQSKSRIQKQMIDFLRDKIKHVVYIVKENRTYDQVLGDLDQGNGDPSLAILAPYSPNQKKLATQFFTLDNFYDSGETSGVGWNWSTAARTTDFTEKTQPVNYAGRGLTYDWEGGNRNVNVGIATLEERMATNPSMPDDPNMLAGTADVAAPDSSDGEAGTGYLWNAALRGGLKIRNYGFYVANQGSSNALTEDELAHPYAFGLVQAVATKEALAPYTDPYFRGYDQNNSDFYLFKEWEREFDQYAEQGDMPNLSLVRFPHDHFGNFSTAKFGVNTVETQMADNDYAVGLVIDKIAHSPFKDNTLVFVVEDDAQNGGDHVDPHRSIAFIAGPYVKQGGVLISNEYTTVNFLHTMLEILGLEPLGINDGLAEFMAVFDKSQKHWDYTAVVPEILYTTNLPLPEPDTVAVDSGNSECDSLPLRNAGYWSESMKDENFEIEDKLDDDRFNRALWAGLKGESEPYPSLRHGKDMRSNRQEMLANYKAKLRDECNSKYASR